MNALGAFILLGLIYVVLGASRRVALLAMLTGVLFLTQVQQIEVMGLNLYAVRFLELVGFIRVVTRREFSFRKLNAIDRTLLCLYAYTTLVFLLRSSDGVVNRIGVTVDAFLCYFTFRGLIGGMEDFRWFLRAFVLLLAPYVLIVVVESLTWHNLFTALGAVDGGEYWSRHGRPRCFGSFRQPDTLGMFAASFLPLYIGLACIARERKRAIIGIGLCVVLVVAANSGGAAAGAAMGLLGWLFWCMRFQMRKVRWGIVVLLVALASMMKVPVWYVFSHISSITGGDGFHRSRLIDMAYQHLGKWWLAGMPIADTFDWFPYHQINTGGADITNQFIAFGLNAGLGAIILFVFLLQQGYSCLGKAMAAIRFSPLKSCETEFLFWAFGVMLAVHIVDWFGITYFDQMYVIWYMQLAAISTLAEQSLRMSGESPKLTLEPEENRNMQQNNCNEFAL